MGILFRGRELVVDMNAFQMQTKDEIFGWQGLGTSGRRHVAWQGRDHHKRINRMKMVL